MLIIPIAVVTSRRKEVSSRFEWLLRSTSRWQAIAVSGGLEPEQVTNGMGFRKCFSSSKQTQNKFCKSLWPIADGEERFLNPFLTLPLALAQSLIAFAYPPISDNDKSRMANPGKLQFNNLSSSSSSWTSFFLHKSWSDLCGAASEAF